MVVISKRLCNDFLPPGPSSFEAHILLVLSGLQEVSFTGHTIYMAFSYACYSLTSCDAYVWQISYLDIDRVLRLTTGLLVPVWI